ncbi:hypothetical protein O97_00064, partial [Bartonella henselae str. Zeus]|uniref:hypothetical protein n=1 Tax=Bartonella henselae TaxID=38323 RepID=UPI00049F4D44
RVSAGYVCEGEEALREECQRDACGGEEALGEECQRDVCEGEDALGKKGEKSSSRDRKKVDEYSV